MFRSIWSKTLRDYRVAILAWGIAMGLLMAAGVATATPAVLAGFASLAPILSFLGDPYAMQTPEGYVTFRYLGAILPTLLSFWTVLAGARLVRGEEERGTMDVLLATPQPRIRLLLEKIGALCIALILIAALFALGVVVGEARIEHHSDVVRALLAGLNIVLFAFFFGMVALLLSQVIANRRAAAGWASGLLLLSLLLYITGREVSGSWLQYLSPFYYYNLNRPLIPSFNDQPVAVLLLAGLSVLCVVGSSILFARRDIGRSVVSWKQRRGVMNHARTESVMDSLGHAERSFSTRSVGWHTLFAQGWASFWWLLGMVLFSVYILLLTPSIQKAFYQIVQQTSWLQQLFFDTPTNTNTALLGTIVFSFMPALVVIFALTLALTWAADLENGRMELILSTPQERTRILLERFCANALVVLLAPVLTWFVLTIGALLLNLSVNQGRVLSASFGMLPPALIILGMVYGLAERLRYAAVSGIVSAYLVLSFLEETLEGIVPWPSWVGSLSIFHLYGNPIFVGMDWGNFLGMTGVGIVLLIFSLVQFRYADIKQ